MSEAIPLSRLASQWAGMVDRSIDRLGRDTLEFMRNELVTIERLVSGTGGQRDGILRALEEIESLAPGSAAPPESPGQQV